MLFRSGHSHSANWLVRLLPVLFVSAVVLGLSVPASGADKDKAEKKAEKDKSEEKAKPGDKVTLKWKFDKDKSFYQTMTTITVQNMKVMTNDVNQTQNQTFYFKWTPTSDVKDDKVTIDQTIIGVKMDIEIGGSKINYDSTKTEGAANNPLADFFKALVGSKFTITLDLKTSKVTKMEGREAFLGKLVAANPQMKPLLDTILSEEALKEMAEPIFAVVPTEPVAKNSKWKKETHLNMGPIGTYDNTYNYTYEGPNDKKEYDVIRVETILKYSPPAEQAGPGGLPFKIKSAKLTSKNPVGLIRFNAKKGRVDYTRTELTLDGELAIEIGGQATKVTLSQVQKSTVETSDENPIEKKAK